MVGWLGMVGGITLNLRDPNEIKSDERQRKKLHLYTTSAHQYQTAYVHGSRRLNGSIHCGVNWSIIKSEDSSRTGCRSQD